MMNFLLLIDGCFVSLSDYSFDYIFISAHGEELKMLLEDVHRLWATNVAHDGNL
jgi:hypothetical protein